MTQQTQEFATPQDALAHYGVKGMQWGVRKAKPTSDEIRDARARVGVENRQYQKDRKAIKKNKEGTTRSERKEALGDLKISVLSNPDRETAFRMTNGEKAVMAVLTVAAPPTALAVGINRLGVRNTLKNAQSEQRARERAKAS